MSKLLNGIIRGRTIVLAEDSGLAEGQEVEIAIRTRSPGEPRKPGDGFLRTEGALADDPHWDAIMEEIQRGRKRDRQVHLEEP